MYVSEVTFAHLRQAADERLHRELEYRRIAGERAADPTGTAGERAADTTGAARRGPRRLVRRFRRPAHSSPRPLSHA